MNRTLHNFFVNSSNDQRRISAALSVLKLCLKCLRAAATHDRSLIEITGLPYWWTPVGNHSISIARQSSARQCWAVLACISDSISQHRVPHTIIQLSEIWRIRWPFVVTSETRTFLNLIACSLYWTSCLIHCWECKCNLCTVYDYIQLKGENLTCHPPKEQNECESVKKTVYMTDFGPPVCLCLCPCLCLALWASQ